MTYLEYIEKNKDLQIEMLQDLVAIKSIVTDPVASKEGEVFPFGAGVYGFLMHMIATGLFVIVAGFMYRHKKTKKEAIMALTAGVVVTVIAMCVFNYFITPLYMGVPTDAVLAMIPTVIIPFNILKAGINALITFFVYKRISGFLHKV